jgi:hypothetical protein
VNFAARIQRPGEEIPKCSDQYFEEHRQVEARAAAVNTKVLDRAKLCDEDALCGQTPLTETSRGMRSDQEMQTENTTPWSPAKKLQQTVNH